MRESRYGAPGQFRTRYLRRAHALLQHRPLPCLSAPSLFGDFAENIASEGIDWKTLPVGTRVRLGDKVLVEITQIGKECHNKCAIYYQAGDCIMPREGVFARVLEEGKIRRGDEIHIIENHLNDPNDIYHPNQLNDPNDPNR